MQAVVIEKAGKILGWSVVGVILAALVYAGLAFAPSISYRLRSPSVARECSLVRPGMAMSELIPLFEHRTPPLGIRYLSEVGQLIASRSDGSCIITLGGLGERVISSSFEPPRSAGIQE